MPLRTPVLVFLWATVSRKLLAILSDKRNRAVQTSLFRFFLVDFEKLFNGSQDEFFPAFGDVVVGFFRDVGVGYLYLNLSALGEEFDGGQGGCFLLAKIPFLDDFIFGFQFQDAAADVAFPHFKFSWNLGRHGGGVARPQLNGEGIG